MTRQLSKRSRDFQKMSIERLSYTGDVMEEAALPEQSNERVWIGRTAIGLSDLELKETGRLFHPHEARTKLGYFSLSVVIPGEIITALDSSTLKSVAGPALKARLLEQLPDFAQRSVFAEVEGLKQYGSWIGTDAYYKSFDDERTFISEYLSDALGIEHSWHVTPHISLAKGNLESVRNRDEIEAVLPRYVQLSPLSDS